MKQALLLLPALAALLAGLLFSVLRERAPLLAAPPPTEICAERESGPRAVQLSYVELAASPHRSRSPGATQVYGRLTRSDDGQPVAGGVIRLEFQDYSSAAGSAAEEHARSRYRTCSTRNIRVGEDGGWSADLPGKSWIREAEFQPGVLEDHFACDQDGNWSSVIIIQRSPHRFERPMLIRTDVSIDLPLECGALEASFAVNVGLKATGLVIDAQSAEPIAGALVDLEGSHGNGNAWPTGADGGFEVDGIDPRELVPSGGLITFRVQAPGHESTVHKVAWEAGQTGLPAFKVVLEPHGR
jgi:hypothetical protein